jgi:hypothetical protein
LYRRPLPRARRGFFAPSVAGSRISSPRATSSCCASPSPRRRGGSSAASGWEG